MVESRYLAVKEIWQLQDSRRIALGIKSLIRETGQGGLLRLRLPRA